MNMGFTKEGIPKPPEMKCCRRMRGYYSARRIRYNRAPGQWAPALAYLSGDPKSCEVFLHISHCPFCGAKIPVPQFEEPQE